MVWACGVKTKRFAYCAELTVRFRHPVRTGVAVIAIGELVSNRRDKLFEARAELRDDGNVVLASANGKYLPIDQKEMAALLEDFEGGPPASFMPSR